MNNTTSLNLFYAVYADTQQIKNVQINIGANRKATYFNLGSIGFKNYNYGLVTQQIDTLKHLGNRIGILKTSASINSYGVYELYVKIIADTLDLLWRVESKGVGMHDSWNWDFHDRAPGIAYPTVLQYPRMAKCVKPDTMYTIVSSFQCLEDITTVANYGNLYNYTDVNLVLQPSGEVGGGRVLNSSLGPTRDGRQKPDIAASGTAVFAAMAVSWMAWYAANAPSYLAVGGKHIYGSGTSAASPVVAGFAALFLQKYPTATSFQVKKAITNCAYTDGHTGVALPDYAWGYGKLDGFATMMCYVALNNNEIKLNDNSVTSVPNPFNDKVNIKFKTEVKADIFVYNPEGKLLFTDKISGDSYDLKSSNFNSEINGLLFVRIISPNDNMTFKLIRAN